MKAALWRPVVGRCVDITRYGWPGGGFKSLTHIFQMVWNHLDESCWHQALMDLDQKLARDEAKIKARSDALLFFWGSCVANDESVRLLLKLYQLYQPYIFRQTRVVECFFFFTYCWFVQPEIPFPTNQHLKDGAGRNLGFYNLEISSLPGTLPQLVPFQGALVQLHDIQSVEYSEVLWGPQKNSIFW